jgi:methylase of polypeptide subunit release factors
VRHSSSRADYKMNSEALTVVPPSASANSAMLPVAWGAAIENAAHYLRELDYRFTAITPETHRRVVANHASCSDPLRAAFGWNYSFASETLDERVFVPLRNAGMLTPIPGSNILFRSRVRFATIGNQIFAHSSFPTESADSVFFGPDTYRFAALIDRVLRQRQQRCERVIDIGCGSGAGGIFAASILNEQPSLVLADVNSHALSFAAANARVASVRDVQCIQSDVLASVPGDADVIMSNPPYLVDTHERLYRHGGKSFGSELSVRILGEALPRLRQGGQLILYTGTVFVDGVDTFLQSASDHLGSDEFDYTYEEIDPDVFGEELDRRHYARAERIAAVGLIVTRKLSNKEVQ